MVRVAWFVLTISSLLSLVTLRGLVAAAPAEQPTFSGFAEIDGPLHLSITISPPVSSPRDTVTVEVVATNRLQQDAAPEIVLSLPSAISSNMARYPSGTTYNLHDNTLSWQPVISAGSENTLSLSFDVSVANVTQPEQTITTLLRHGDNEQRATATFWIGLPPTATINVAPRVAAVGQTIQLQAVTSGPGPITQQWSLGDGREIGVRDPEIVYAAPGTYEIELRVANPLAATTAISEITIVPEPTAEFTVDDDRFMVGQPVQFTNHSGGARPLSFHWEFGDGHTSQEVNPSHTYETGGDYTVQLVVESEYGKAETSLPLIVGASPIADFVLPEQAVTGEAVQGHAFSDDTVTTLQWDMGDGRTYQGETMTHIYNRVGEFEVTLLAANDFGETVLSRSINVGAGTFSLYLPLVTEVAGYVVESVGGAAPPAEDGPDPGTSSELIPESSGGAAVDLEVFEPVTLPDQTSLPEDASPPEQLLWYINEARRLHDLPPLQYNYELSIAAQHHTLDMAENPGVMHEGSDSSRPAERQNRYDYLGIYGGEAVAWGWESAIPVVEFWVNSPPHRTLILNPQAREVGVGYTADGTAPNIWYWAAEFGILLEE
ncbi:MAG TPA: PKD domain-containing protein [Candidatus Sulfomarinibacteraceae bacterium]|nr:PKD domain-containing protein [Candidatus Sulfomarinibacteraceae bacterium]